MNNLELKTTTSTKDSISKSDFDLLFDTDYWEKQEIFTSTGNEKYIRDYTIYEGYDAEKSQPWLFYKTGGLVIDGDRCWYKEGYIKPTDVLLYKDVTSAPVIKSINFNDLVVCAIMLEESYYVATMSFSIMFRHISTGDFYNIGYDYSLVYQAEEYASEEDLQYYAHKAEITEEELISLCSKNNGWTLYNTLEYLSKRRSHRIGLAVSG